MKRASTKRQRRIFPAGTPIIIGDRGERSAAGENAAMLDTLIMALEQVKAARHGRPARRLDMLAAELALLELEAESEGPIRRIE